MTPEQFDEYTVGRTFSYGLKSTPYGAEEYLSGRRVRWSFLDGHCIDGEWFVELDLICFVYEADLSPQCWSFYLDDGRMVARFENDPAETTLYELNQSQQSLYCLGPDVGA